MLFFLSLDSLFLSLFDIVKGRAKVLPLLEVLGGIAAAFVILIASYRINSGFMTIGSVIGFVTALLMLAQPARALGTFNTITVLYFSSVLDVLELISPNNSVFNSYSPSLIFL